MISAGIMHTPSQKNSGGLLAGIFRSITAGTFRLFTYFHSKSRFHTITPRYSASTRYKLAGVDGLTRLCLDIPAHDKSADIESLLLLR